MVHCTLCSAAESIPHRETGSFLRDCASHFTPCGSHLSQCPSWFASYASCFASFASISRPPGPSLNNPPTAFNNQGTYFERQRATPSITGTECGNACGSLAQTGRGCGKLGAPAWPTAGAYDVWRACRASDRLTMSTE